MRKMGRREGCGVCAVCVGWGEWEGEGGVGGWGSDGECEVVEMSGLGEKEEWEVLIEGGKEEMERRFEWRAARMGGSGEVDGQAVQGAFRFVDAESKAVYAMYTEAKAFKGLKKRGR